MLYVRSLMTGYQHHQVQGLENADLLPKNWTKTNVKNLLKSALHNQEDL
jgi:hypothetical protein